MYVKNTIIVLCCLLVFGIFPLASAEENELVIKSGTIIRIMPNLKYMTESFLEPTGVYATEGCVWRDLNTFKWYIMEEGKWVNAEKTSEISEALTDLTNALNNIDDENTKQAVDKVKKVLREKYKDKDEE